MGGIAHEQRKILYEKGFIPALQAAKILGIRHEALYKLLKKDVIRGVRIGHWWYVKKESLAVYLRDCNPHLPPEYVPWLLGLEADGECRLCAIKIPISKIYCSRCTVIDLRNSD